MAEFDDNWADGPTPSWVTDDSSRYDDMQFEPGLSDGKTAEQVEAEAGFEVPDGTWEFFVKSIKLTTVDEEGNPVLRSYPVYLGSEMVSYASLGGYASLGMVSDPNKEIRFNFRTPPKDPAELKGYTEGTSKPNGHKNGKGWWWKNLKQFLHRIGHDLPATGELPPSCRVFKTWKVWPDGKPRRVMAKVIKGRPPEGEPDKKVFNQIEPYSFAYSADTNARKGIQPSVAPGPSAGHSKANGPLPGQSSFLPGQGVTTPTTPVVHTVPTSAPAPAASAGDEFDV